MCMNSKGPSLVDLDTAETAADPRPPTRLQRRSVIGVAGFAGLAGLTAAIAGSSSASASPKRPTDADRAGLEAALRLELTASALYDLAVDALAGDDADFANVVSENHEAYAQAIAGTIGVSAQGIDDDLYDSLASLFATSDAQGFARAARDLENTAVETHTTLLGAYEGIDAVELTASILVVEARHATVFTSMAGFASNLDDMLGTTGGVA